MKIFAKSSSRLLQTMLSRCAPTLVCLALAAPAAAVTVSLVPGDTVVSAGSAIAFDLVVSGLGDGVAPSVGGFDIDLLYDPAAISTDIGTGASGPGYDLGTALGDPLLDVLDFSFGDDGIGTFNLFAISTLIPFVLDPLQSATVVLATVHFTVDVLPAGASTLIGLSINELASVADPSTSLVIDALNPATLRAGPGSATPVPEPALPALAILVLLAWRPRRGGRGAGVSGNAAEAVPG